MRLFNWIMYLWCLLDLTIANSAPVKNRKLIEVYEADVDRWRMALFHDDHKLGA